MPPGGIPRPPPCGGRGLVMLLYRPDARLDPPTTLYLTVTSKPPTTRRTAPAHVRDMTYGHCAPPKSAPHSLLPASALRADGKSKESSLRPERGKPQGNPSPWQPQGFP